MGSTEHNLNILLIEDSTHRMNLIKEELAASGTRCRLHTVGAGPDTLRYLKQEAPYENVPRPDLVLLDFSLPQKRYLGLIEKVKSIEAFSSIPFVVLTRPESESILEEKYAPKGNCVMFSPIEFGSFLRTMNANNRDRFMNAIVLIADMGLVLVRTSEAFEEELQEIHAASYM